jgi:hypothetical protein
MIATKNPQTEREFVVHPMFDKPEEKRTGEGLGLMTMSGPVKLCLMLLRGYLTVMTLLLAYHLLDLAGAFGRHVTR